MSILEGKSNRLQEIDIIRSLVIVILVAYHSFAPFTGGWGSPVNVSSDNAAYFWLGKFLYSGMLETFVFISGYVFALGAQKRNYTILSIIKGKIRRLYLPCVVFGIIFVILFGSWQNLLTLHSWISIFNGIAHLWFLPMLFWCFILEIFIINIPIKWAFLILLISSLSPLPTLPFHFNASLYYILFFHMGYICFSYRYKLSTIINRYIYYIPFWLFFYIVIFYLMTNVQTIYELHSEMKILEKIQNKFILNCSRILPSFMAVLNYYFLGLYLSSRLSNLSFQLFKKIAFYSFGVYIYQEIILRVFYYKTSFCVFWGDNIYPFIGALSTLLLSFILSYISNNIRYVKKLL